MLKLVLKKFGLSFLTILGLLAGLFIWGLAVFPFNLPYLLHLPTDETNLATGSICALLFVSIVTVSVRTKWCLETDLFFAKPEEKPPHLLMRIITSQEFLADVIVFAAWMLGLFVSGGVTSGAPWYRVMLGTVLLLLITTLPFAAFDCLLYTIARKKADKRLYRKIED